MNMKMSISELQEKNNSVFKEIVRICEDEKIPYIGMFGTMLGAVRHKGAIPWDYDIDMAVPFSEYKRFISIMESKLPPEYRVDYRKNTKPKFMMARIGLCEYETKKLHVDVYPLIGLPDSLKRQKWLFKQIRWAVAIRCAKAYKYTGKKGTKAKIIKILTLPIPSSLLAKWYDHCCGKYPYETAKTIGCSNAASGYKRTFRKEVIDDVFFADYEDFKIKIPKGYDEILKRLYKDYMQYPPEDVRNAAITKYYEIEKLN